MNLRSLLPGIRPADLEASAALVTPATLELASPWAPTHNLARVLDGLVLSDVFGGLSNRPVTRAEAMAVPAVARARHIICGTVARIPLHNYRDGQRIADAPWQAARRDSAVPGYHQDLWTTDDHLFYGWSCWTKELAADDRTAAPPPATASADAPAQPSRARRLSSRTDHHRWRPRVPRSPGPLLGPLSWWSDAR